MNNKIITNQAKEQIKFLTADGIRIAGGQNEYARRNGISSAHISNLMNSNWEVIAEKK